MRFSLLLLFSLLIVFIQCKPAATTETPPETEEEAPSSDLWLNFPGNPDAKNIVLVSGDEEYRSEEALPQMARILSKHHGFNCTVLFAQNPEKPGLVDPNYVHNIPGLEQLKEADLMMIFTRFRALPNEQMQHIDDYLSSGRPVIGIRTSTHAFRFQDSTHLWRHYGNYYDGEKEAWKDGFGRLVLGEKWISHHGHHRHQSTRGVIPRGMESHPIATSLDEADIWGPTDVYGVRLPLPGDSEPIILGMVVNRAGEYDEEDPLYGMRPEDDEVASRNPAREESGNPNDPMMPIAWTKSYQLPGGKTGKAFASTIGSSTDMLSEGVRRMYVNATYWALDMPVPAQAKVDIVGKYDPSPYAFHDDAYWQELDLKLSDIQALDQ